MVKLSTQQFLTLWTRFVGTATKVFIEKLQNPFEISSAANRV
jgi:hypothetical protein